MLLARIHRQCCWVPPSTGLHAQLREGAFLAAWYRWQHSPVNAHSFEVTSISQIPVPEN